MKNSEEREPEKRKNIQKKYLFAGILVLLVCIVGGVYAFQRNQNEKKKEKQPTISSNKDTTNKEKQVDVPEKEKSKNEEPEKEESEKQESEQNVQPVEENHEESNVANFYEDSRCSFEYPQEWIGKIYIESNEAGIDFYQLASYQSESEYCYGWLYSIDFSTLPLADTGEDTIYVGNDTYQNPGYMVTLGTSPTGVNAYMCHPTDVQFDPANAELADEYQSMSASDWSIIQNTFQWK